MRVLVTGASGFVGRALVVALASSSHTVRAAVGRTEGFDFPAGVEVTPRVDLASAIDWMPLLAGTDAVVHLAGIAHVGSDVADALYDRVNHRATAELAAAAQRAAVKRFVLVSSVRAQCGPTADHVLTEADEPRPTDAYGRSKLAAELAVRAAGVPFTILRPVLVYGPGVKGNFAALARLASLPLPLPFGSFQNRRSLLSRDNLIAAIQFVLSHPTSCGEMYLAADAEPVTLANIIASLRRCCGRSPGLLNVPPSLVGLALRIAGGQSLWERLSGDLVVDPDKLIQSGWRPASGTLPSLVELADGFR
jgi:UDP-glucose 4-epimerase